MVKWQMAGITVEGLVRGDCIERTGSVLPTSVGLEIKALNQHNHILM